MNKRVHMSNIYLDQLVRRAEDPSLRWPRSAPALLRQTPYDAPPDPPCSPTRPDPVQERQAFETWLKKNHAASDGLWLKIAKRGANEPSVSYAEGRWRSRSAGGWIDGQKKGPRRPALPPALHAAARAASGRRSTSARSRRSSRRVACRRRATRRSRPLGRRRWAQAYDGARTSAVPEDLLAALEAEPGPRPSLPRSTRPIATRYCAHTDGREG